MNATKDNRLPPTDLALDLFTAEHSGMRRMLQIPHSTPFPIFFQPTRRQRGVGDAARGARHVQHRGAPRRPPRGDPRAASQVRLRALHPRHGLRRQGGVGLRARRQGKG